MVWVENSVKHFKTFLNSAQNKSFTFKIALNLDYTEEVLNRIKPQKLVYFLKLINVSVYVIRQ